MLIPEKFHLLMMCVSCNMILSISLDDKDDIKDLMEGELELECPCSGRCKLLPS